MIRHRPRQHSHRQVAALQQRPRLALDLELGVGGEPERPHAIS